MSTYPSVPHQGGAYSGFRLIPWWAASPCAPGPFSKLPPTPAGDLCPHEFTESDPMSPLLPRCDAALSLSRVPVSTRDLHGCAPAGGVHQRSAGGEEPAGPELLVDPWRSLKLGMSFPQVQELKQQIEEREEELARLRMGMGVTDSEKRIHNLTVENESLKQSLSITQGLLHDPPCPQISAYESEITKLREMLQEEISHLEAQKAEAIKEATECSEQHLEQLQEQVAGTRGWEIGSESPGRGAPGLRVPPVHSPAGAESGAAPGMELAAGSGRDGGGCVQRRVLLPVTWCLRPAGNIRVLCRIKPVMEADQQEGDVITAVSPEHGSDSSVVVHYKGQDRTFELDKVFLPEATQEEVFLEIDPLVQSCLDGYNVCIFAYGQTGSGKTYTMEGVPGDPGINQRALRALYREMEARAGLWKYSVSLSMVEIYNEVIRDLLGKEPQEKLEVKLNPDGSGRLHVPGLTCMEVTLPSSLPWAPGLPQILSLGTRNRTTSCTNMNERSSRSHVLLTVTIAGTDCTTLNLVDLAGSERVWKSGAQGERLKEAQNINKSLLALGEVIQALRAKQAHVPFRNSKLTYLLQDSLHKGNKMVMMVQISQLEKNLGETVCSLKFAQRVCKVELGPASRRIESGPSLTKPALPKPVCPEPDPPTASAQAPLVLLGE
uniref:Kinesin family member C2 n=1 Tax=Pelusios castaneus TaxID=367368 RepID=A0A8C8RGR7_9SAUR